jgi:hypothetical protein
VTTELAWPSRRHLPVSCLQAAQLVRGGQDVKGLAAQWQVSIETVARAVETGERELDTTKAFPVVVSGPYRHGPGAWALRRLYERRIGAEMTYESHQRLEAWIAERMATGTVLMFDIRRGPNPACPAVGGWYYAPRRPETPADQYFQHQL